MDKPTRIRLSFIAVAVIFGSAVLIWSYNRIQGRDLSQPPDFDLSAYNELDWATPEEIWPELAQESEPEPDPEAQAEFIEKFADKVEEAQTQAPPVVLLPHSIYFSNHFKGQTSQETRGLIENFIQDFAPLSIGQVEDLYGQKCYEVELPVEGREELLAAIELHETIERFEVAEQGAPYFDLCFRQAKYLNDVKAFLTDYPAVIFQAQEVEVGDYVARLIYDPANEEQKPVVAKLQQEYSDVVFVTE
jgi:hypothetical protein